MSNNIIILSFDIVEGGLTLCFIIAILLWLTKLIYILALLSLLMVIEIIKLSSLLNLFFPSNTAIY